ncbi:hypothetical protein HD554DRAFT_2328173 [Boletus coccyginus]|nr:hypothetical protein HD554DRAFT_2328173 [Boletus coccyginus]
MFGRRQRTASVSGSESNGTLFEFSWEDHARGIHAFLTGLGIGVDVDFLKRRMALVGRSIGWRDIWHTSEEVFQALLKSTTEVAYMDERILKIFVPRREQEHGFRPLPTAENPELKEGVTLKCIPPRLEGNSNIHHEHAVHVESGGISDFASVTRVPGAGHMTRPDAVADVIWKSLTASCERSLNDTVVAKLLASHKDISTISPSQPTTTPDVCYPILFVDFLRHGIGNIDLSRHFRFVSLKENGGFGWNVAPWQWTFRARDFSCCMDLSILTSDSVYMAKRRQTMHKLLKYNMGADTEDILKTVLLLVENGCDVHAHNPSGETSLQI